MSRSSWIAWAIALVLILLGLWLVDRSVTESLVCLSAALLAMLCVVAGAPPSLGGTAARAGGLMRNRGPDASWALRKDGNFKIQGMGPSEGQTDEPV